MIKTYLTCERYLEHYNKGEKTVVGRLDTPKHICVTETDMSQETVYYNDIGMKVPRRTNNYLVGPIADALHAYEELGYTPEELKKIIEEHKEFKRRVLYISTAVSSAYGTLGSPFGKKFQEMREEIERKKRFYADLDFDVVRLSQTIFNTDTPNKNNTIIKEEVMNKNFTKADLEVGYVVKTRKGDLYMVTMNADYKLVMVTDSGSWMPLYAYNNDLTDSPLTSSFSFSVAESKYDIVEVYGYSLYNHLTAKIGTYDRKLLWKREEKTCDKCIHKVVCSHVGMCEHYAENK